jgi:hypothetical protein
MKILAVSLLTLSLASAGIAQLRPGAVVRSGEPFPFVADFNGDGLDDLIQERNVLLNSGGSFDQLHDLGLPSDETVVAILDVNGDHRIDLITLTRTAGLPANIDPNWRPGDPVYRLYIADASRNYSQGIALASGIPPFVADVDGDGKDDVLLTKIVRADGVRSTATDVTILRSLGDGTFEHLPPFRIGADVQMILPDDRILTGDLDHDGIPDLVIRCAEELVLLHGTGGGKFTVDRRYMPLDVDYGWWSTRLADIDGDGNLDVVFAGMRSIRVLFGDGRGNLPRTARVTIPKLHDASVSPVFSFLSVDTMNQPRDLAIGHFTRTDQMQIAAGTGEGDLVVFAYDQGALHEVSRTSTEFWLLTVHAGSFRGTGLDDIYTMGTLIWGEMYPRPRVFSGDADHSASAPARVPLRTRAARMSGAGPATPATPLQIQISGDCIDETTQHWTFLRDGVFGTARHGDTTIQAVFDDDRLFFRLDAPYAALIGAKGILTETNGSYGSVTTDVLTTCGWRKMTLTARKE